MITKDGYDWFFDFNMHFLGLTKEEARLSMQRNRSTRAGRSFRLAYTWAVTLNTMLALEGTGAEHFDLFSRLITLMEDRATKENISLDNLPEVGFDIPQSLLLTGFLDMNGNKPFSDHDAFDMYYFWHLTYLAATRIEAQMEEMDVLRYIPESRLIRAYYTCKEQERSRQSSNLISLATVRRSKPSKTLPKSVTLNSNNLAGRKPSWMIMTSALYVSRRTETIWRAMPFSTIYWQTRRRFFKTKDDKWSFT